VEFEPRGVQGRVPIIREGTADRSTVTSHHRGFRTALACEAPFDGAYPADTLLELFLGMTVHLINGLGRLAEVVEVAQLVRHIGEHVGDGTADRELAVRNDAYDWYRQGLSHCPEQDCQILLGRGQQATGQKDFAGEAVPEDPQHLMADIGLQAIEGQNDPALRLSDPLEARRVGERESEQFVVAVEQMGDCPGGDGHSPLAQVLIDFRQTAVLRVAQGAYPGNDIEAKLVPLNL
jgi:hypothetical protein